MNIASLAKIGIKNILRQKKYSLLIITTLFSLTSLIFLINILVTGPINAVKNEAAKFTDNTVYVSTTVSQGESRNNETASIQEIAPNIEKFHGNFDFTIKELSIRTPQAPPVQSQSELSQSSKSEEFEELDDQDSESPFYTYESVYAINLNDLKKLTNTTARNNTEDAISIVISTYDALRLANQSANTNATVIQNRTAFHTKAEVEDAIEVVLGKTFTLDHNQSRKYFIVAVAPAGVSFSISKKQSEGIFSPNFNLLDSLSSSMVFGPTFFLNNAIVIDGSAATTDYLSHTENTAYSVVASFKNVNDALSYYKNFTPQDDFTMPRYTISSLWGNQFDIERNLDSFWASMDKIVLVLSVALFIIFFSTLSRLITSESRSIALFQSLGASNIQIIIIYAIYMLSLCIFSIILALLVSLIVAYIMISSDVEAFKNSLAVFYLQTPTEPSILLGIDLLRFFQVCGLILLAPVASILFASDQFLPKHIAKRLKRRKK